MDAGGIRLGPPQGGSPLSVGFHVQSQGIVVSTILALDPGPEKTGWVHYGAGRVLSAGISPNADVLAKCINTYAHLLAIEMVASYGMPVGREVFETCVWIGRLIQAWPGHDEVRLVYRQDVKLELCGTARAKDLNVRQALIDRIGRPGTKRNPGPTYGVSGHMWAALGVAVVALKGLPKAAERPAPLGRFVQETML